MIPLQLWLAAAEIAGKVVLEAWRRVLLPVLRALGRAAGAAVRFGQRHVTPARGVAAVGLVAAGALAASQWLDYRSISIGADAYSGAVGDVAPPPLVDTEIAGHAHGWVMLPLALLALVALVLATSARRRRRIAWALIPIGIAVIAISLAVDAPKGLDEGARGARLRGREGEPARGLLDADRHRRGARRLRAAAAALPAPGAGRRRGPVAVGPSPAAALASRVKAGLARAPRRGSRPGRGARPRRARGSARSRKGAKRKVQGAGT